MRGPLGIERWGTKIHSQIYILEIKNSNCQEKLWYDQYILEYKGSFIVVKDNIK